MDWKTFKKSSGFRASSATCVIIGSSTLFQYVMIKEGVSRQIADFICPSVPISMVILLVINMNPVLLGMVMEPGPS
jgi:TRAP-type C4-dicarboxylate transport system permease large subunit